MEGKTKNSQDVGKWIELANAAADEGNKEKARECLLNAVKIDPESVQAWNFLSYFAESRDDEIHALEKVLELQPENESAAERLQKVEDDTY